MTAVDSGLLLMRLVVAYYLVGHGLGKLGFVGGAGLVPTAAFFESVGYRPGRVFALAAAVAEIGTACLLALGLLTPLSGAAAVVVLVSASLAVPATGSADPRRELARVLAVVPAGVTLAGAGAYSLDALIGLSVTDPDSAVSSLWPAAGWVLLVLAAVAVVIGDRFVRRR